MRLTNLRKLKEEMQDLRILKILDLKRRDQINKLLAKIILRIEAKYLLCKV